MNMDKPLRRVAVFGGLLIFGLMAQINYVQGSQAEDLRDDPINTRKYLGVFNQPRGDITAGGEVLARSVATGKTNPKFGREYKEGEIFFPVTGYFNGNSDKTERAYNSLLTGTDKRITQQRWFDMFIGKKPQGANVELALNPAAQRVAYRQLQANTRRAGAAVVDIRTGAVVVLASDPSFDPNTVAPQRGQAGTKAFAEADAKRGAVQPLLDNAMRTTFPPGSSFKIITAAGAIENLGLNENSTVNSGSLVLPESGRELPDSHEGGQCASTAPLKGAFADSCNTTFGELAMKMGIQKLSDTAGKFGFGKDVFVEPGVAMAQSVVPVAMPDPKNPSNKIPTGQDGTARSGIGQENVRATPLQMAMVASAVANNGKMMKPYLVQRVRDKEQTVLYQAEPKEFSRPIKPDTASQLADMMRAVVTEGTAKNLAGANIAGKTGTAEQGGGIPNSRWFVGFAPANNPRYAFAVVTEGAGSGGESAGPMAATIMNAVLKK